MILQKYTIAYVNYTFYDEPVIDSYSRDSELFGWINTVTISGNYFNSYVQAKTFNENTEVDVASTTYVNQYTITITTPILFANNGDHH